jgi:hypothetical protein
MSWRSGHRDASKKGPDEREREGNMIWGETRGTMAPTMWWDHLFHNSDEGRGRIGSHEAYRRGVNDGYQQCIDETYKGTRDFSLRKLGGEDVDASMRMARKTMVLILRCYRGEGGSLGLFGSLRTRARVWASEEKLVGIMEEGGYVKVAVSYDGLPHMGQTTLWVDRVIVQGEATYFKN